MLDHIQVLTSLISKVEKIQKTVKDSEFYTTGDHTHQI